MIGQKIAEIQDRGFCVLPGQLSTALLAASREAFWPVLAKYLDMNRDCPNRGPSRHFLPLPFEPPCYAAEFFFDTGILAVVHGVMDDRVVADQWGCDVPLPGSDHQQFHADYQRPLFAEAPNLPLPAYMLSVSFGLLPVTAADGPLEIAPDTHRLPRNEALRAVACGAIKTECILLNTGDVLIRHPWALHRGTPNTSDTPRPLATIRYVRRWYTDGSCEANAIPRVIWRSLTPAQQTAMRFPVED